MPTFTMTYAGIGFRMPTKRIRERLRRYETLAGLRDVEPLGQVWPGPKLLKLGAGTPFKYPPVRIGDFFYPVGASRWSIFRGVMAAKDVAAVQAAQGGAEASPQTFRMQCGGEALTTSLYLLPPIPIAGPATSPSLFLVTLVDERYFWHQWQNAGVITCTSPTATWADLLGQLAAQLGITLSVGTISSNYGSPEPDSALYSSNESAAVLLDVAAANVGCAVVRDLDGSYALQRYATAIAAQTANRPSSDNNLYGGMSDQPILPQSVTVTFPQWVTASPAGYYEPTSYRSAVKDSYGAVYSINVAASSLGSPYSTYPTYLGQSKLLATTAKALYATSPPSGSPTNSSALTSLAEQLAKDYYDGRTQWLNESYQGILPWTPEGVSDVLYCWRGQKAGVWTRTMSPPFNAGIREFQHGLGAETPGPFGITVRDDKGDSFTTVYDVELHNSVVTQVRGSGTADWRPDIAGVYQAVASLTNGVNTCTISSFSLYATVTPPAGLYYSSPQVGMTMRTVDFVTGSTGQWLVTGVVGTGPGPWTVTLNGNADRTGTGVNVFFFTDGIVSYGVAAGVTAAPYADNQNVPGMKTFIDGISIGTNYQPATPTTYGWPYGSAPNYSGLTSNVKSYSILGWNDGSNSFTGVFYDGILEVLDFASFQDGITCLDFSGVNPASSALGIGGLEVNFFKSSGGARQNGLVSSYGGSSLSTGNYLFGEWYDNGSAQYGIDAVLHPYWYTGSQYISVFSIGETISTGLLNAAYACRRQVGVSGTTGGGDTATGGIITALGTTSLAVGMPITGGSSYGILYQSATGTLVELTGTPGQIPVFGSLTALNLSGDVTMSSGAVVTIASHAVTYAKMQQASMHTLLGNPGASTANIEEITLGPSLAFSGTTLNASTLDLIPTAAAAVSFGGQQLNNVANATHTTDAPNWGQVQLLVQGLQPKDACQWATAAALAANTYVGGSTQTLTGNANGAIAVDGGSPAANDRILVKNEATGKNNGIYVVTTVGTGSTPYVLTRSADCNTSAEVWGLMTFIEQGTINASTLWANTNTTAPTLDTTALTFGQLAGAGTYTAGTGLTLTGTQYSITNTAVTAGSYGASNSTITLTVNAQGQITACSTVTIGIAASQITSGQVAQARGGTGLDTSSVTNGQLLIGNSTGNVWDLSTLTAGSNVTITNGGGTITIAAAGSVSSVGASGPSGILTWSSPVTSTGTLTASLVNQSANTFFAGPSSGSAAAPTFRAQVVADLPAFNGFTSAYPAFTDALPEYNATAAANRSSTIKRLGGLINPYLNGCRLYLTSGTPFPTADETGKTTLYWGPAYHNRIAYWDGTGWNESSTSELSLAVASIATTFATTTAVCTTASGAKQITAIPSTTGWYAGMPITDSKGAIPSGSFIVSVDSSSQVTINQNCTANNTANDAVTVYNAIYDAFVGIGGSSLIVTVAWTNSTTRATALTYQDGVPYVTILGNTYMYVGTLMLASATTLCNTGFNTRPAQRYVWNAYNQIDQEVNMFESTNGWTYNSTSWQVWNADPYQNFIGIVVGLATNAIDVSLHGGCENSATGQVGAWSIAVDSETTPDANSSATQIPLWSTSFAFLGSSAKLCKTLSIGFHRIFPLEANATSSAGSMTFLGTSGAPSTTGPSYKNGLQGKWAY